MVLTGREVLPGAAGEQDQGVALDGSYSLFLWDLLPSPGPRLAELFHVLV